MKPLVVVLAILIVLAGLAIFWLRGRPVRPIDGLSRHRKHMDALSSDARREVIDRVENARRRDDWNDDRREERRGD